MKSRSKRYSKAEATAVNEALSLQDAVDKVKSFDTAKFDQTVELVMQLGIDPKQADQLIRGAISLPHGTGKQRKQIQLTCALTTCKTIQDTLAQAGIIPRLLLIS